MLGSDRVTIKKEVFFYKTRDIDVGMHVMVTLNLAVKADLAKGSQGVVINIQLDLQELTVPTGVAIHKLVFPPVIVMFRPDHMPVTKLEGLPNSIIPIQAAQTTFRLEYVTGKTTTVYGRQLAMTPGYTFTDYKAQEQMLHHVIVDIGKVPSGKIDQFNTYISLSQGTCLENL